MFSGAPGPLPRFPDFALMAVHLSAVLTLVVLICGHVCAALFHRFHRRDHLLARVGIGSIAHPP